VELAASIVWVLIFFSPVKAGEMERRKSLTVEIAGDSSYS